MKYILYLLTGLILLAISLYQLKQSLDFIHRSERAIGTVTSLEENDGAFSPVFTVKTKEGDQIIYHHPFSSNPASWAIGEEATFLCESGSSPSAKMMSYFGLFDWAIVFMAIAVPLIVIGAGYYLLRPLVRLAG